MFFCGHICMAHRTCPWWQTHVWHGPNSHDSPSYLGEREPHYTYSPYQRLICSGIWWHIVVPTFQKKLVLPSSGFLSPSSSLLMWRDGGGRFLRNISNFYLNTPCPTPGDSMLHRHWNFYLSVCLWNLRLWQQLHGAQCYGMWHYAVWKISTILQHHICEYNDLHICSIYVSYLTFSLLTNITDFGMHVPAAMSARFLHFVVYIWGLFNDAVSRLYYVRSNEMNKQETMWKSFCGGILLFAGSNWVKLWTMSLKI
jgi:hypothetical protein